jgi:hypothetical protein
MSFLVLGLGAACTGHNPEADQMKSFGGKADVVFFYSADLTQDQRAQASETLIEKHVPGRSGHDLPDGVREIFMVRNGKYDGFAINFQPNATPEEKRNVIKALRDSAAVFRVFENVEPNGIGPLSEASPESMPTMSPKKSSKR